MTTRVVIVRHGQSTYNAQKKIQGRCDESVLTDKGRADAKQLAQALDVVSFDAIYCSPLQRAKQTAEVISENLSNSPPLNPVETLLEVDLLQWEKRTKTEVGETEADKYHLWHERPHELTMTRNGKTFYPVLRLYEQGKQFWQDLLSKHEGQTVLVVAHNGINRCLIMSAVGIDPSRYQSIQQSNCAVNVLNFAGGLGDLVQFESLNQTAHLGIPLPSPRPNHQGVRLLLVRHGETQWNKESRFQGQIDIPLNDNGKAQAQKAADFLQNVKLDFAISSPMFRPKETAEIILQHHDDITLELKPRLSEIGHGLWEGKLESEIKAEYGDLLQQWKTQPETVQMPEGENLQQVWDRAIACWEDIVKECSSADTPQTGIVVAHDAINKVILCYLLGLQPANIWSIKQGNGGVSVIDYPQGLDGQPVIQALNITSHLSGSILDSTAAGAL
jgi:broad specificity phosphatase PhoE